MSTQNLLWLAIGCREQIHKFGKIFGGVNFRGALAGAKNPPEYGYCLRPQNTAGFWEKPK
jgi:hypothetical protein